MSGSMSVNATYNASSLMTPPASLLPTPVKVYPPINTSNVYSIAENYCPDDGKYRVLANSTDNAGPDRKPRGYLCGIGPNNNACKYDDGLFLNKKNFSADNVTGCFSGSACSENDKTCLTTDPNRPVNLTDGVFNPSSTSSSVVPTETSADLDKSSSSLNYKPALAMAILVIAPLMMNAARVA